MKAYDFFAEVTPEEKTEFSEAALEQLPANQDVRTIVQTDETVEEENENTVRHHLVVEQIFKDYSDADAIYDEI
jgi:hypothetical protein